MSTHSKDKPAISLNEDMHADSSDARLDDVDNRLQEMVKECGPFYRNPNLFKLYLLIVPGCLMAAVTLGFDASMLNGLQAVPAWLKCTYSQVSSTLYMYSSYPIIC